MCDGIFHLFANFAKFVRSEISSSHLRSSLHMMKPSLAGEFHMSWANLPYDFIPTMTIHMQCTFTRTISDTQYSQNKRWYDADDTSTAWNAYVRWNGEEAPDICAVVDSGFAYMLNQIVSIVFQFACQIFIFAHNIPSLCMWFIYVHRNYTTLYLYAMCNSIQFPANFYFIIFFFLFNWIIRDFNSKSFPLAALTYIINLYKIIRAKIFYQTHLIGIFGKCPCTALRKSYCFIWAEIKDLENSFYMFARIF